MTTDVKLNESNSNPIAQDAASLAEKDQKHNLHPFAHLREYSEGRQGDPRIVTGGKGVYIQDQHGKKILDAFSGLYCVNIGYGRQEIAEAIYEQAKKVSYCHTYYTQTNEPVALLADKIIDLAPDHMERVFFGMSGSDANETNVKLVWYYHNVKGNKDKKKIIARKRGYHGSTVISGSLTGLPVYHGNFDQPFGPIRHTTAAYHYGAAEIGESEEEFSKRCAKELEDLILEEGPDTIGAFIAEPVMGTGGLVPPPEGYWPAIQAVLEKYDVLLIADEVVTGFGRTGSMFGSIKYDIKPDLITIAKGLTSAYIPLSGSIVSEKVSEVLKQGSDELGMFSHGYTYTGHALGAAAGLANLKVLEDEKLIDNVVDVGDYFQKQLQVQLAQHPIVGEVRGVGLMGAVEFAKDKDNRVPFDDDMKVNKKIADAVFEHDVIVRPMPNSCAIGIAPPFVITKQEIDKVVGAIKESVDKVAKTL